MSTLSPIAKTSRLMASTTLFMMVLGSLGAKFGLLHYRIGLLLFALAAVLGIIVISVAAFSTRRQSNEQSRKALSSASVIAAIPVLIMGFSVLSAGDAPMIHEVSTDLEQAPVFIAAVADEVERENQPSLSEEVKAAQRSAYPELKTILSELTPEQAYAQAKSTAESFNWEILAEHPGLGTIEAVDTSFWFGFKDDIAIRITPREQGSAIDLRSLSRVGKGDLGANAKRVTAFIEAFSAH